MKIPTHSEHIRTSARSFEPPDQALRDEDQPPIADDANVALLAWYRHLQTERLATKDEIARVREALPELDGAPQTPIEPVAAEEGAGTLIASAHNSPLPLAGSS